MELGNVEFYVLRDEKEQFEATVIQFEDHSELLRVIDSDAHAQGKRSYIDKASAKWMKVHAALANNGILRGKVYDIIRQAKEKKNGS